MVTDDGTASPEAMRCFNRAVQLARVALPDRRIDIRVDDERRVIEIKLPNRTWYRHVVTVEQLEHMPASAIARDFIEQLERAQIDD